MIAPKLIPLHDMVPQVGGALKRLGFRQAHTSESGSRYFTYPGCGPFQLRISDHHYSGFSHAKQAQVVKSVALRPVPQSEIPGLALEFAIGFLVRIDLRHGVLHRGDKP